MSVVTRHLDKLQDICDRLLEYYTPEEAHAWLDSCHPQLEGKSAIDLIHDCRSIEVLRILERLDSGIFV